MKFIYLFQKIVERLAEFLFPNREAENILKILSLKALNELREKTPRINKWGVEALLPYRDKLIRSFIWLIKYKGDGGVIKRASEFLFETYKEEWTERAFFNGGKSILLATIPPHKERIHNRGFNQMELVMKEIIRLDDGKMIEYQENALKRVREVKPQTSIKNRAERLKNQTGSLVVTKPEEVWGRVVYIIDDVTTTGATLEAGREAFLKAGAKEIHCVALAH